ncbi:MAG: AmmeMemoRadiSam system protein A [Cyanobacteriota bacterium]
MVEKLTPPALARKTVESYVSSNLKLDPIEFKVTDVDVEEAGVFVSIKLKNGDLRGCIGTIFPTQKTIEQEIITNAISASTQDPRFTPIGPDELGNLVFSVDVMQKPEQINDVSELDPHKYGIIVKSDSGRQALLLPNLEGVDTVEHQVAITKRKAGIPMNEPVHIFRFRADRYYEEQKV